MAQKLVAYLLPPQHSQGDQEQLSQGSTSIQNSNELQQQEQQQIKQQETPNVNVQLPIKFWSQHTMPMEGTCCVCALTSVLNYHGFTELLPTDVLNLALENNMFSKKGNGMSGSNLVKLCQWFCAELVEFDYLTEWEPMEAYKVLEDRLVKEQLPVIVAFKFDLQTAKEAEGHAAVLSGLNTETKFVTLVDSFSKIATRTKPRPGKFPHGKLKWTHNPGLFNAHFFDEFDPAWNTQDYNGAVDVSDDPAFVDYDPSKEGFRFYVVVRPPFSKQALEAFKFNAPSK